MDFACPPQLLNDPDDTGGHVDLARVDAVPRAGWIGMVQVVRSRWRAVSVIVTGRSADSTSCRRMRLCLGVGSSTVCRTMIVGAVRPGHVVEHITRVGTAVDPVLVVDHDGVVAERYAASVTVSTHGSDAVRRGSVSTGSGRRSAGSILVSAARDPARSRRRARAQGVRPR